MPSLPSSLSLSLQSQFGLGVRFRVVRSSVKFAPDGGDLVFRYKGTKELKVPILSAGIGIPAGQVSRVCPVRTLKAYLNRFKDWDHGDRVWCCTRKQGGKYLPATEKGCTLRRWMRNMMTRVGIDPKWTGGSIRMAASSKALDDGLEPAYIMHCLLYTSPSPRDATLSRMPSSA